MIRAKNVKKIIMAVIIILLLIFILFRIGIGFFQTPKWYITWYFNKNYEDFNKIADYLTSFDNNLEFSRNIVFEDKNFSATESGISSKIIKTLQLGNYDNIDVVYSATDHDRVDFVISNFIVRAGEPYGIVYSELEPNNLDYPDDYVLDFEKICDNWYYCYRVENRTYGA